MDRMSYFTEEKDRHNPVVRAFVKHILPSFQKAYYCGYPLDDINERQIFRRLIGATPQHLGFCYESSALNMIALKSHPSAQLVRGRDDSSGWHSWVEVDAGKVTLAIDPCWIYSDFGAPFNFYFDERDCYRKETNLIAERVYSFQDFWAIELSHQLSDAFKRPAISHLSSYLLSAYRPIPPQSGDLFSEMIEEIANSPIKQDIFIYKCVSQGFVPHNLSDIVKTCMENRTLNADFKQPADITPFLGPV